LERGGGGGGGSSKFSYVTDLDTALRPQRKVPQVAGMSALEASNYLPVLLLILSRPCKSAKSKDVSIY